MGGLSRFFIAVAVEHAEDDGVRIDLRVGPREVDLVEALHKRHNPLFFDQCGLSMIELNLDPLANR